MHNLAYTEDQSVSTVLDRSIQSAAETLLRLQNNDGHFAFELEADATIPAEYILLDHFLNTIDQPLHERMGVYLRAIQEEHGGWPLFHRGDFDISASVKAYFALKCVGDDINAPHMARAREAILRHGGAAKANVFTRFQMALFGAVPWKAVPVMPVEIMLLPRWFPFHLSKVSYWSRTVIVPMLVLMAKKPRARNPRGIKIDELFVVPPQQVKNWHSNQSRSIWNSVFRMIDAVLRAAEPLMPAGPRRKAITRAVEWIIERLNGEDGLGAIYPAMANTVMMFDTLGYAPENPHAATARRAVDKLVTVGEGYAYCQPCLSPVWDTALAGHALMEAGAPRESVEKACEWLAREQILDVKGDWADWRPDIRPGGWAFQYANDHYPDVDDTAVVAMLLHRLDADRYTVNISRAAEWVRGMQSKNGGWGAFDADNTYYYLNHIPFADHGALLDPPTVDVSARCVGLLVQTENVSRKDEQFARAVDYLIKEQEPEGCWFGRWGTNYVYGTWSALVALDAAGVARNSPVMRRAVDWLVSKQRSDGGWGEDGASYWHGQPKGEGKASTPSQTAWALLGLIAAGEANHPAVESGISYLIATQNDHGLWDEDLYTAVGFPRVFYLRYHGYKAFFPLWALARYRNVRQGRKSNVNLGM
ncbi:MAG: squalene--hopene cyclase [Bdellovibrionales bacterium]